MLPPCPATDKGCRSTSIPIGAILLLRGRLGLFAFALLARLRSLGLIVVGNEIGVTLAGSVAGVLVDGSCSQGGRGAGVKKGSDTPGLKAFAVRSALPELA